MKINDKDAVQQGWQALRADADACELPCDARTQALLYRAAELLQAHDALVAALQALLRAPAVESGRPGSVTIEVQAFNLNAARAALAKAHPGRSNQHDSDSS